MATLPRNPSRAALLGVASTIILSSCALPPREAWQKIQDDGLIAYIKYELETPRHGAPAILPSSGAPGIPQSGDMVLAQRNLVQSLKDEQPRTPLTAFTVPALPGYVRSPYTNPPRLVDVRGVRGGTTMVCPYTHRMFIVPGAAGTTPVPGTMIAQESDVRVQTPEPPAPSIKREKETESPRVVLEDRPETTAPAPAPSKRAEDRPVTTPTPAPSAPSVASTSTPAAPAPTPSAPTTATTPSKPSPAPTPSTAPKTPSVATNTPPVKPSTPAPLVTTPTPPAPKPMQELPFGDAIPGRPGFVNSPYAAKHQLVDVTGLPAGMEVKCPYTGKLFRVPMQDMASSKPLETVPPLASPTPDKPKKK